MNWLLTGSSESGPEPGREIVLFAQLYELIGDTQDRRGLALDHSEALFGARQGPLRLAQLR
jgi:hypothetical protein